MGDDVSDVETVVVSDDDEEPSMINTLTTPAPEPTNRHVQINSLPEVRVFTHNTEISQRTEETVCSLELPSYDESEARSLEQPSQGEEPWLPMPDLTMYKDPAEAERKNREYINHKRMHIVGSSRPAWSKRYRQDPPSQSDVVTTDHMILTDEVEEADVPTQPVSEEDDELSVPNATATVAIDATQYTTCTPFQSLESGFGNDPRYNPSLRMRSKSVHIFESSTHQPLQPPKIYADAQECADAYQTTVQAVLRSCLEKVNIGKGHYAQFFDTDHTHEIWKEHPDFPGYFFSSRGAVLGKSKKFWRSVQRKVTER
ncbi:hypothetical protein BC832DRAFT_542883 [Gaertneriomyces semiglobifer]|nr:hypothetical protein BC832DRAFT_542883 [Gaertneriomyces semiglobifer]